MTDESTRKPVMTIQVPVDPSKEHGGEIIVPEGDEDHHARKIALYTLYVEKREELGLADTEIAELMENDETIGGVDLRQIAQWMDPHPGAPPIPKLHRNELARVLKVKPEELWPDSGYEDIPVG